MKPTGLNVLVLGFAAVTTIVACNRTDKQMTGQDTILKAECHQNASQKQFNTEAFIATREKALTETYGSNSNEPMIRTYVQKLTTKFDANAKGVIDTNVNLISAQDIKSFKSSKDVISVNLNCETLKADVSAPGFSMKDMDYEGVPNNKINKAKGIDLRKQILLTKHDDKVGDVRVLVGQYFDESASSPEELDAVAAENKRTYKSLKMSVSVTRGNKSEELELLQRAGIVTDDAQVKFDSSVAELLAQRLGDRAPKELKVFMGDSSVERQKEGLASSLNVPQSKSEQKALSLKESDVLNLELNDVDDSIKAEVTNGKPDAPAENIAPKAEPSQAPPAPPAN
jgi:hypothetical protein